MNKKIRLLAVSVVMVLFFLIPSFSQADTLNQVNNFYVNANFDKYGRKQLSATLRYVSDKLYFYVDDSYWNGLDTAHQNSSIANMKSLGEEFENNIYPKETRFWGSEANPGIDGDPRITILVEPLTVSNGGYFNTA